MASLEVRMFSDLIALDQNLFEIELQTIGGGFRYLIARRLGLKTGIDIPRGPEEWAFYLQVGSAR